MLITLFTDISHDHRSGVGAYGWWAKADGTTYRGAGVFRELIIDNNVAEVYGLINGVYASIHDIRPPPRSRYIAQTDSGVAIAILEGRSRERYEPLRQMMTAKLAKHGLHIEYRHVSGHRGNATPRNAVNSWCDRAARQLMKQRRAELETSDA